MPYMTERTALASQPAIVAAGSAATRSARHPADADARAGGRAWLSGAKSRAGVGVTVDGLASVRRGVSLISRQPVL